jgi:hypothetical protein
VELAAARAEHNIDHGMSHLVLEHERADRRVLADKQDEDSCNAVPDNSPRRVDPRDLEMDRQDMLSDNDQLPTDDDMLSQQGSSDLEDEDADEDNQGTLPVNN